MAKTKFKIDGMAWTFQQLQELVAYEIATPLETQLFYFLQSISKSQ